jgi:hypothetical protein
MRILVNLETSGHTLSEVLEQLTYEWGVMSESPSAQLPLDSEVVIEHAKDQDYYVGRCTIRVKRD